MDVHEMNFSTVEIKMKVSLKPGSPWTAHKLNLIQPAGLPNEIPSNNTQLKQCKECTFCI